MRLFGWSLAALLVGSAASASAQDADSAGTFVVGLYAAYHGKGPDYLGRQAKAVFSPRLLALIRRDRARTPKGDAPSLDGDPICGCQDFGGLKFDVLEVTGGAGGRSRATVRLWFPQEVRILKLDLVAVDGHWRVDDVHSDDTPSLAAFLGRHFGGR